MARRITRIAPAYRDTGGLRAQDNVDLDVFIGSGDRVEIRQGTPSPFFSGREAEIQAFYRTLFHFGRGSRENLTHVVEGPPGSGKSALMVQCMEEARRFEPARNGARWLTVRLPASATGSPAEFAAAVNEAITARVAKPDEGLDDRKALLAATAELVEQAPPGEDVSVREAAALIRDTINELVGATQDAFGRIAEGARLKAEKIHAAVNQSPAAKIIDRILRRGFSGLGFSVGAEKDDAHIRLHEVLRKYERTWKPYNIVLFIDEAQNIPVDSRPEHVRDFFSSIHEGTARPRLAICAFGLTGTLDKIRAAGVSRLQAGHFHISGRLRKTIAARLPIDASNNSRYAGRINGRAPSPKVRHSGPSTWPAI